MRFYDNVVNWISAIKKTFWMTSGILQRTQYDSNNNIYWGQDGTLSSWQIDQSIRRIAESFQISISGLPRQDTKWLSSSHSNMNWSDERWLQVRIQKVLGFTSWRLTNSLQRISTCVCFFRAIRLLTAGSYRQCSSIDTSPLLQQFNLPAREERQSLASNRGKGIHFSK